MKALIQKELRENLKLAVLGLVIFSALLALDIHSYTLLMKSLADGGAPGQWDVMQPLISSGSLGMIGYFCGIFGAVLGWFQIHNERQRDLWAFLVHRPATRTQIFLGKILAGVTLYLLAAGLPLAVYLIWMLTPGHVAAPFEWAMLQPAAVFFLSGILYYFAGMLTGLRQARWYASRALGLGLAVLVSIAVTTTALNFWQVLATVLIGGGILATAVWGGFHSNGFYRNQPAAGKLSLIATLMPGCALVVGLATGMLLELTVRPHESRSQSYHVTKDGTIYTVTRQEGRPAEIADLEGKPLVDPKTGRTPEWDDFSRSFVAAIYASPNFRDHTRHSRWYNDVLTSFLFWRATPDALWYYWDRYERLVGYDRKTRQLIGSLGPNGYSRDLTGNGDRFEGNPGSHESVQHRIIYGARAIYEPDPERREVKVLFTATNESCAVAGPSTNQPDRTIGAAREVQWNGNDWNYTVVVTPCFVRLLTPDGRELWRAAYQPAYPDYSQVQVFFLESTNQYLLWISPGGRAQHKAGGKLPVHVTWLERDGNVLRTAELPDLAYIPQPFERRFERWQKLLSLSIPPTLYVLLPLLDGQSWWPNIPWELFKFSLAAAVICLPIGWWLGRRYGLSLPARLGWAVFQLAFGVPGLLTQLSVEEWPARETCPGCKKLRVVDREKCEHCGADFAPPEKTGIEVFESLATVK